MKSTVSRFIAREWTDGRGRNPALKGVEKSEQGGDERKKKTEKKEEKIEKRERKR